MNRETQPLISVIVPIYNVEKYLPECLDSLLAQTYAAFELLLVDDGSPDGCWQILQRYAQRDERVHVFRKENGGVSSARNFGLERAQGEYITFVDPDDAVAPGYLQRLYALLQEHGTRMAVCEKRPVAENGMAAVLAEPVEMQPGRCISTACYQYGGAGSCSECFRTLYHRSLLQHRFDETLTIGEDTIFFLKAFLQAQSFAYSREKLYFYRQRQGSAYKARFTMKQYTEVLAWEQIRQLAADQPEPLRRSVDGALLSIYARVYYRMNHAGCEPALQKELLCKARQCRSAFGEIVIRDRWNKIRVWTLLYCPWLGRLLWDTARRVNNWQLQRHRK